MVKANSKTAMYLFIALILVWLLYSQVTPGARKMVAPTPDVMGYNKEEYEMGTSGGSPMGPPLMMGTSGGSQMGPPLMMGTSGGSPMGPPPMMDDLDSIDLNSDYLAPYDSDEMAQCKGSECAMNAGVGLASSLLPREVAKNDDFGKFVPEEVLKGQNFLDPRMQIGFPETIGGTLRNANQQIRAEPPNPKQPFMWNNSTIVPDMMQRPLFT